MKVSDIRKKRAAAFEKLEALVAKDQLTPAEKKQFDELEKEITTCDGDIERAVAALGESARNARPVVDSATQGDDGYLNITAEDDPYTSDEAAKRRGITSSKGLRAIAAMKCFIAANGDVQSARSLASEAFGERHSILRAFEPTARRLIGGERQRALVASVGASGGFIVPPDYMNEIIELLRPMAVVRSAGPRTIPMPRGTMTLPSQTAPATASYGSESAKIPASQETVGQIVASYKKLTALVPVTNDLMRYADPAADAFVRDDLVKVIALREDLAFLLGDGTQDTPRGYTSFANSFALQGGGTAGVWSSTANSVAAAGGNFITSTLSFTLATVASELGGLVNKLDTQNVPDIRRVWFMHPRSYNYLFNVQNSLGVYVYREELLTGRLLGYPVKKSTQIPINIWDTTGTNKDCSFVILAEMDETMILDSMSLELAVSREGMYVDAGGTTVSAFQSDQTLIRAIAEHDFQMRHTASVAVDQLVRWAPAIS